MGNKPNRLKKLKNKALRRFSQIDVKKRKESNSILQRVDNIKPFNAQNAKEMLRDFKKQVEHVHLKNKPHHHKRTTPGSMDAENPHTQTGHENMNKTMRTWQKGSTQKSSDLGKKYFKTSWKKAA